MVGVVTHSQARTCDADVETLRNGQCDDVEIQAHVLMHDRGRCPDNGDAELAEYQREVEMIRGYGLPRCGACRGDGSFPDAVCVLPVGHYGPHYG